MISRGSYGSVYTIKDGKNIYAVKKIPIFQNYIHHNIISEIIYSNLRHQNIIHTYDNYFESGYFYKVMEYMPYTLGYIILKKNFNLYTNEIYHIISSIINGVGFLNAHNIIHADIKPDNILIDDNLNVKIIDMGLSVDINGTKDYEICTMYWRAPELNTFRYDSYFQYTNSQDNVDKHFDIRVDSWAIGTIMIEIVIKRDLWACRTLKELAHQHYNYFCDKSFGNVPQVNSKYLWIASKFLEKKKFRWTTLNLVGKNNFNKHLFLGNEQNNIVSHKTLLEILRSKISLQSKISLRSKISLQSENQVCQNIVNKFFLKDEGQTKVSKQEFEYEKEILTKFNFYHSTNKHKTEIPKFFDLSWVVLYWYWLLITSLNLKTQLREFFNFIK